MPGVEVKTIGEVVVLQGETNYLTWRRFVEREARIKRVWTLLDGTEKIIEKRPVFEDHLYYIHNGAPTRSAAAIADGAVMDPELSAISHADAVDEWRSQQHRLGKASALLYKTLSASILGELEATAPDALTNVRAAMDHLSATYKVTGETQARLHLLWELERLQFAGSMEQYLDKHRDIYHGLRLAQDPYTEEAMCSSILRRLPPEYENVRTEWERRWRVNLGNGGAEPVDFHALSSLLYMARDLLRYQAQPH